MQPSDDSSNPQPVPNPQGEPDRNRLTGEAYERLAEALRQHDSEKAKASLLTLLAIMQERSKEKRNGSSH